MTSSRISVREGTEITVCFLFQWSRPRHARRAGRRQHARDSRQLHPTGRSPDSGARRTKMTPVSSWTSTISADTGSTVHSRLRRLGGGFLGTPNRANHSVRRGSGPAIQDRSLGGREGRQLKAGGPFDDWLDFDAHAGGGIKHGEGDGDTLGMCDRDRGGCGHRGFTQQGEEGTVVFILHDRQVGGINSRVAGVVPESPGCLLGRDPSPEPLRSFFLGACRVKELARSSCPS